MIRHWTEVCWSPLTVTLFSVRCELFYFPFIAHTDIPPFPLLLNLIELKMAMIDIYNRVLDEREAHKRFVIEHGLLVCGICFI